MPKRVVERRALDDMSNGHTQSTVSTIEHAISAFLEHGLETNCHRDPGKSFLFPNVCMFCGSPSIAILEPTDFHHIIGPSRNSVWTMMIALLVSLESSELVGI
jgi:hypothetical protein